MAAARARYDREARRAKARWGSWLLSQSGVVAFCVISGTRFEVLGFVFCLVSACSFRAGLGCSFGAVLGRVLVLVSSRFGVSLLAGGRVWEQFWVSFGRVLGEFWVSFG